jgi:hypothetical protein
MTDYNRIIEECFVGGRGWGKTKTSHAILEQQVNAMASAYGVPPIWVDDEQQEERMFAEENIKQWAREQIKDMKEEASKGNRDYGNWSFAHVCTSCNRVYHHAPSNICIECGETVTSDSMIKCKVRPVTMEIHETYECYEIKDAD